MTADQEIRELIQAKVKDGRVACKVLLELAEQTQTPSMELGKLCDEMKIRITGCQLGCFN